MKISRKDVIDVLFLIVKAWPYGGWRPDTIAVVDNAAALESTTLGKTYNDYLHGTFWSRKWVMANAPQSTMSKSYPLVAIEQKVIKRRSIHDKQFCYDFWVSVLDVPDCDDCTEDNTDELIQRAALDLTSYLKEVVAATVTYPDGTTAEIWATGPILAKMRSDGLITAYRLLCDGFDTFVSDGSDLNVTASDLGMSEGARGVTIRLQVCTCVVQPDAPLEVPADLKPITARTACATC